MRLMFCALAALALSTPAAAQDRSPDNSQQTGPGSLPWHNLQQAALHQADPADGWVALDGGVRWRRVAGDGTGPAPTLRDQVTVEYTGSLADGTVFDSNVGRSPATFPLARLIPAWQVGIPYMGVGDTIELIVPMEMGYGLRGSGPIPGSATLLFTVTLLDVIPAGR